jgi:hypothetical protein
VVGGEGGLALQAVTPTHPMPPQDELDAKFAELVVSTINKYRLSWLLLSYLTEGTSLNPVDGRRLTDDY